MPAVDVAPRLVAAAIGGDQRALERLLRAIVDDVRRLAQRMLWHPEDAEDATQEILVKVATRLSTFRGDARVTTWVYRIAVNHLLTTRRRRAEDPTLTFDAFGEDPERDLDVAYDQRGVDDELLAQEVMVGCTQGMLLCLDREQRMAYILGGWRRFASAYSAPGTGSSSSWRVTAGSSTPPTRVAADAASAPPSTEDAWIPAIFSSAGGSMRSSSTWSASRTPVRSSAATPSCARRRELVDAVMRAVA